MQMNVTQHVPASQARVWAALNDPDFLKRCIPGCESMHKTSPTEMTANVVVRIGPVKATFDGKVTLSELNPPNGCHIAGEGSGGLSGFAKGGATVELTPDGPNATHLHYVVDAHMSGKLAQLGSLLIHATARKLVGEFFQTFAEDLAKSAPVETAPPAPSGGWRLWLTWLLGG